MKRVLLKLSGEALAGEKKTGFDEATVIEVAKQIRTIAEEGLEIGIVIGGGNFWRGRTSETIDRNKADQIGMLATVMNCIYVSDICRYLGLKTEIFTHLYAVHLQAFTLRMQWKQALHRARSYFCRWYRTSLLLHRYSHCTSRSRDRSRSNPSCKSC